MSETGAAGNLEVADGATTRSLPFESTVGHLLRRAQQRHTALWTAEFGGELTGPQYAVLSVLKSQNALDQRVLGEATSLDKSTVADVIARLERHQWVARQTDPADARRNLVTLTAPARAALLSLTAQAGTVQEQLLSAVPGAQQSRLVELLALIAYSGTVPIEQSAYGVLPLPTTPGHLLRRAEQLHGAVWADLVGASVTPSQFALLCAISSVPGASQAEASTLASLDKSSGADIVARLSRRGLLTFDRDARDARRKVVHLSPAGVDLLAETSPVVSAVQDRLLDPLSGPDEREALVSGLRTIAYAELR
ncbi:MarR family winged helix-turn-helix transcriptional regulator [Streptomyces sp. NPDC087856]|uniref:MarR family winged helix-turn-helix transcriptional regulator n=1 Tax=Streptomyces sp. NPDC087856 TaxID=3365811 RepID=UPI00382CDB4D